MMDEGDIKLLLWLLMLGGTMFIIGYGVSNTFDVDFLDKIFGEKNKCINNRIDGLWFVRNNITNRIDAADYAINYTKDRGRWICVNINNMGFEREFEVCRHETAHEIWSRYCQEEENFDKCINITK